MNRLFARLRKNSNSGVSIKEQLMYGLTDIDWYDDIVQYLYDKIINPFNSYIGMWRRFFYYGWKLRWNYDFDAHTIYEMIYLKLDSLHKTFNEYGHLMWNSDDNNPTMRKLRIAKILAKRLFDDKYLENTLIPHTKKWGESTRGFFNNEKIKYKKCKNLKESEQAVKEMMKLHEKSNKLKEIEKNELFKLLNKYIPHWWD